MSEELIDGTAEEISTEVVTKCILTGQISPSEDSGNTALVPGNVTDLQLLAGSNGKIYMVWGDPDNWTSDEGILCSWKQTTIVCSSVEMPTEIPFNGGIVGQTWTVGSTYSRNAYSSSSNPFIISGLTNGTTYYVKLFPTSQNDIINDTPEQNEGGITVTEYGPGYITNLRVIDCFNDRLLLTWTDPDSPTVNGVTVSEWRETTITVTISGKGEIVEKTYNHLAYAGSHSTQFFTIQDDDLLLSAGTVNAYATNSDGVDGPVCGDVIFSGRTGALGSVTDIVASAVTTNGGGSVYLTFTNPASTISQGYIVNGWAYTKIFRTEGDEDYISDPYNTTHLVQTISNGDTSNSGTTASAWLDGSKTNYQKYNYSFFAFDSSGQPYPSEGNANVYVSCAAMPEMTWELVGELVEKADNGEISDLNDFLTLGQTLYVTSYANGSGYIASVANTAEGTCYTLGCVLVAINELDSSTNGNNLTWWVGRNIPDMHRGYGYSWIPGLSVSSTNSNHQKLYNELSGTAETSTVLYGINLFGNSDNENFTECKDYCIEHDRGVYIYQGETSLVYTTDTAKFHSLSCDEIGLTESEFEHLEGYEDWYDFKELRSSLFSVTLPEGYPLPYFSAKSTNRCCTYGSGSLKNGHQLRSCGVYINPNSSSALDFSTYSYGYTWGCINSATVGSAHYGQVGVRPLVQALSYYSEKFFPGGGTVGNSGGNSANNGSIAGSSGSGGTGTSTSTSWRDYNYLGPSVIFVTGKKQT